MAILADLFEELAGLARAPGMILGKLTTMEARIMAELDELEQAIRDEVAEVITATLADAEVRITEAVNRADTAEDRERVVSEELATVRDRIVTLTGEVRAPGAYGQTTDTTTGTTTGVTTDTTTEVQA